MQSGHTSVSFAGGKIIVRVIVVIGCHFCHYFCSLMLTKKRILCTLQQKSNGKQAVTIYIVLLLQAFGAQPPVNSENNEIKLHQQ